jgi:hypothetical protein
VGRVLRAPERFLRQLRTLGGRALRSGDRLRCGLRWRWGRRLTAATLGVRLGARGASCSSAWRRLPWWGRGGGCGRSLFSGSWLQAPEGAALRCCRAQALEDAGLAAHGAVGYGDSLENHVAAFLTCERVQVASSSSLSVEQSW